MDESHSWLAAAYVERNPVRVALVDKTREYRWSAAAALRLDGPSDCRVDLEEWRCHFTGERWREALHVNVREEAQQEQIREATRRGCPLGSEAFVDRLGRALGRDLHPRPPGRPPKRAGALTVSVRG